MCTGHVRATGRPMSTRVLGSRKWSRPGRVGAGCDALVLGLHATRVGGCRSARLCRDQGKGWLDVGRRHLVLNIRLASRVPSKQRDESSMVPLRPEPYAIRRIACYERARCAQKLTG